MRKVVRALCYLKELCLMVFFKLFGAVCRCCSAKYRELWLVCERGNDAQDNGYWFYRYLKEKHPEINVVVSDFMIHLQAVWMFTLFEEMLKHAIDSKEMEYIVHEYILFEIQGWRALLRV